MSNEQTSDKEINTESAHLGSEETTSAKRPKIEEEPDTAAESSAGTPKTPMQEPYPVPEDVLSSMDPTEREKAMAAWENEYGSKQKVAPTTFHRFQDLPMELRNQIEDIYLREFHSSAKRAIPRLCMALGPANCATPKPPLAYTVVDDRKYVVGSYMAITKFQTKMNVGIKRPNQMSVYTYLCNPGIEIGKTLRRLQIHIYGSHMLSAYTVR
jgi:hypothetical protein